MMMMSTFMALRETRGGGEKQTKQKHSPNNTLKGKTRQTDTEGHERENHSYEKLNTEYQ